jgi:hypothetical protein
LRVFLAAVIGWLTRRWFYDFIYDIFITCILYVFCFDGVRIVFSGVGWGGGGWRQGTGRRPGGGGGPGG